MGRTSIAHSALLAMSQTALGLGLGRACTKVYVGLCFSCEGLQTVADASARHLSHRQRLSVPGKWADGLQLAQSWLRRVSDLEAPQVAERLQEVWERAVQAVQPESWRKALAADVCAECAKASGRHVLTSFTYDMNTKILRLCIYISCLMNSHVCVYV